MKRILSHTLGFALAISLGMTVSTPPAQAFGLPGVVVQQYVINGPGHFINDIQPLNTDGTYNVVIEIPAGTTAKYEAVKETGVIELEQRNGKPRYVQYLPYPGNYGLIPRTILPKDKGGDGDAVDVLVLGDALATGSVVRARPIAILRLLDGGEIDDKIIMAAEGSPFYSMNNLAEIESTFPGALDILRTWFISYKGYDKDGKLKLSSTGFAERVDTIQFIGDAILEFEKQFASKPPLDPDGNPYLLRHPLSKNWDVVHGYKTNETPAELVPPAK